MLSENIKTIRKAKGLSQEELAIKLNVVRQTISKWEQGLSVPDADILIRIADALDTPVSVLLGETITAPTADELKAISEKLEIINLQLAQRKRFRHKLVLGILLSLCVIILAIFAGLFLLGSPYLDWDYSDPELAVVSVLLHAFVWFFIRLAPIALIIIVALILILRKKF